MSLAVTGGSFLVGVSLAGAQVVLAADEEARRAHETAVTVLRSQLTVGREGLATALAALIEQRKTNRAELAQAKEVNQQLEKTLTAAIDILGQERAKTAEEIEKLAVARRETERLRAARGL